MLGLRIRAAAAAAVLTLAAPLSVIAVSGPSQAAGPKHYASCTKLAKDFKHGVSKSKKAALRQVRDGYGMPAYSKKAKAVYWENHANLDRDDDGTACER